jgi:colanic acid biosynthesis glycosyl transferase WcaI
MVTFHGQRSDDNTFSVYTGELASDLAQRGADIRVITGVPHYPQWQIYDGFGKSCIEKDDRLTVVRRRHSVPANQRLVN